MRRLSIILVLLFIWLLPIIAKADSLIVKFITISNTIINENDEGIFYIGIENKTNSIISIEDISILNKNLLIQEFSKCFIKPGEIQVIEVNFLAINRFTGITQIEIKYKTNNSSQSIYVSTQQFSISEGKTIYNRIFEMLIPVLVGALSSLIVNYIINHAKYKKEDKNYFREIKASLSKELKNHNDAIKRQAKQLQTSNWERIINNSSLYAFCIDCLQRQLSIIESYYDIVLQYNNSNSGEMSEKFDKCEKMKKNNEDITGLVNRMYMEKGILGRIKLLLKVNIKIEIDQQEKSIKQKSA